MIDDDIKQLMETPEYKIKRVVIDQQHVFILVSEITDAQKEIPKVMDGREVKILKLL